MSGDEAVALEVIGALIRARALAMKPRERTMYLKLISEELARPASINDGGHLATKARAVEWWRSQLPKLLAP